MMLSKIYIICLIIALTSSSLFANMAEEKIAVAVLYSEKFLMHDTGPGHPENPERLSSVINTIKKNTMLSSHIRWPIIKKANIKNLRLVHTQEYIDLVANEVSLIKGKNTAYLSTQKIQMKLQN